MKKIFTAILLLMIVLGMSGCKKETTTSRTFEQITNTTEDLKKNDVVSVQETLSNVTVSNSFVSASFNLDNGSLISFKNVLANTEYLIGKTGGNWAMTIDVSTSNPFRTNYKGEKAVLVSSRNQIAEYHCDKSEEQVQLTFTYKVSFDFDKKKYTGIEVKEIIEMNKGSGEVTFNYNLKNSSPDEITICNFTGAQLSGLQDSKNENLSLFWPNKEGKIYKNAIEKISKSKNGSENLNNVYPGTLSIQLVELFSDNESLYYMMKDASREYKIANYGDFTSSSGYDFNGVTSDERISLSFTQFPFVGSGTNKNIFETVIGVSTNDSWYQGADSYQNFLKENNMLNEYKNFVENWSGFIALVGSNYGDKVFSSYLTSEVSEISYPDWVSEIDESTGIDTEVILGWNDGGFDSMYPDYDFADGVGFNGKTGFTEMSEIVHQNGDLFCCHVNSRIADAEGNWSKEIINNDLGLTNLYQASVKRAGFNPDLAIEDYEDYMICETYGSGTVYYVMSSASSEFQNQLKDVVKRLRESGANGLWFDQLNEKDAYLDYDESHKMSDGSTPATLFGEGYLQIFQYFEEIEASVNTDEPWMVICGGLGGDAFAKYTDVYGGSWNRKLGGRDNTADNTIDMSGTENCDRHLMSPELIEYTVPSVYIGQAGAGTLSGQTDEYARAFVFGSPFLVEQTTTSTSSLVAIYDTYPDIFYHGVYKDMKGLTINNDEVIASTIISKSKKAFAVQLYNYSNDSAELSISINLGKLGLSGKIESITNLFTGEEIEVKGSSFAYKMDSCGFTSFYVTYK